MRWYRALTVAQQRILAGLAVGVIVVFSLLGWSVWQTLRLTTVSTPSPLPTPTPGITPTFTPTAPPTLTPTPSPTFTPMPTPTFDIAESGAIAAEIAGARGVWPRWTTPLTLVDVHELSAVYEQRSETDPPLALELRPLLSALRLWWWDDLSVDAEAYAKRCAALYVAETEELYLRRDWAADRAILDAQVAFGYARAIPDQYGDLPALVAEAPTLDRRLALLAVGDGDAMLSVLLRANLASNAAKAKTLRDAVADAWTPAWSVDDPLLNGLARLSLDVGEGFAVALHEKGGAAALDEAIQRPPRSTEQLLHPERYASGEMPLTLPSLAPDLGKDWALTLEDTLGEAFLELALLEWRNGKAADASDWGGDLLQVWGGPEGRDVVVLQTRWDSAKAAARFYTQIVEALPEAFLSGPVYTRVLPDSLPAGQWWDGRLGAIYLRRTARDVILVWGNDAAAVETIGALLWVGVDERP
ncbi:MAG TPA: hypothetical protein PKH77_00310 [Anaerolineae bacterium]|nr:hypothetical protein [Anaerolineae bacterium]